MKRLVLCGLLVVVFISACVPSLKMTGVNGSAAVGEVELMIQPHQSLGLEPTPAVRRGDISVFLAIFPKRLFGEYFPGRLRWNTWFVGADGAERLGQIVFAGMHPSGDYFGVIIVDGQVSGGQVAILSTMADYIYSPFGKEIAVERGKFLSDSVYRLEKIKEVSLDEGKSFDISYLSRVENFRDIIKSWNQIQFPEGYLLSPYGAEEVALIRGINPEYDFFQKLVGNGRFAVPLVPDPIGFAISVTAGAAMDLIRAASAPSKGWDYRSELPSRRNMAFVTEYLLTLAEIEVRKRNAANAELLKGKGGGTP